MIWAVLSWYSAVLITLNGPITGSDNMDILGNQVHVCPVVQMLFPNSGAVFHSDSLPIHTIGSVQSLFEEHEDSLHCLPWPAQSPDLSIIEPLWWVLESRMRCRSPPPSSLKQLEDVLRYSTTDYSKLVWVYSKKDTSCIAGKWWSKSILINECVSFANVSIIWPSLVFSLP